MARTWTIARMIAVGFGAVVALAVAIAGIGIHALRQVVADEERILAVNAQNLHDAEEMHATLEQGVAEYRAYLLTRDDTFMATEREARARFVEIVNRVEGRVHAEDGRRLLDELKQAGADLHEARDQTIALLKKGTSEPAGDLMRRIPLPKKERLYKVLSRFVVWERRLFEEARAAAASRAAAAVSLTVGVTIAVLVLAIATALALGRAISRQIGSAIQHVQGSSTELQAAATQQATGAKEQSSAMAEIATTICEMLATSRQIAESAKRVASIAEKTAASGRSGEDSMQSALDAVGGIKRQVDTVASHMLDLGKRSQQIGSVLEIINELAEQTNILAINATIEAAGATEAGRRFAVVADEIRKLADRVGASTKEIRGFIEEIRAAVNATVMATEGGSKAVDSGVRQFTHVATSFKQIVELVGTSTDAAREIELSTKQQSTAVEQVNVAISNVAQTTRETETSSTADAPDRLAAEGAGDGPDAARAAARERVTWRTIPTATTGSRPGRSWTRSATAPSCWRRDPAARSA